MTPASLLKRLLVGRLAERYEDPKILPYADRPVLQAVAELVVASDEPGVYRPDPEFDGVSSLAEKVARKMRAVGAEDDVAIALERLTRLGYLLVYPDGSMRLAIPAHSKAGNAVRPEDLTPSGLAGKYAGLFAIGARKAGESRESYTQRQENRRGEVQAMIDTKVGSQGAGEAEEAYRRRVLTAFGKLGPSLEPRSAAGRPYQTSLMLPQTGGRKPDEPVKEVELANLLRSQFTIAGSEPKPYGTLPITLSIYQTATLSGTLSGSHSEPLEGPSQATLSDKGRVAAAAFENDSSPLAAAASSLPFSADARDNPPPNPPGNPLDNPLPAASDNPPSNPAEQPKPADADRLAGLAAKLFHYDKPARDAAPAIMQRYLDGGWSPEEIEVTIREFSKPNKTAEYFDHRLHHARGKLSPAGQTPQLAAASDAPPRPLNPKIQEYGWVNLPREQQVRLDYFLTALAEPDQDKSAKAIQTYKGMWSADYNLVLKRHPEMAERCEAYNERVWEQQRKKAG